MKLSLDRPTLKLHNTKPEPHLVLVEFVNQIQSQLETLVHDVTQKTMDDANATLLDAYAAVQNRFADLRAAVLDHAYVAKKLEWVE